MPQGILNPVVTCLVLAYLCGGMGSRRHQGEISSLSGPKRLRFGHVKRGPALLGCTKEKWSLSLRHTTQSIPNSARSLTSAGATGNQEDGASGSLLRGGGVGQPLGKVEVTPIQEPHNSVFPGLCSDLGRVKPPRVGRVGLPGAQRVGLAHLLYRKGASQVHG